MWWRRLAYFASLGVTAFVGLFVLRLGVAADRWYSRVTEAGCEGRVRSSPGISGRLHRLGCRLGLIGHVGPDSVGPHFWFLLLQCYPLTGALALGCWRFVFSVSNRCSVESRFMPSGLGPAEGTAGGRATENGLVQHGGAPARGRSRARLYAGFGGDMRLCRGI